MRVWLPCGDGVGVLPVSGLCFGGGGGGFGVYIPAFGVYVFVGKMCRSSPTCLVFCSSLHCLFASTLVLQSEKFASLYSTQCCPCVCLSIM